MTKREPPHLAAILAASGVVLAGCGSTSPARPAACTPDDPSRGVLIAGVCKTAELQLLPRVRYGEAWHGAGSDGACTVSARQATCPAGASGAVELDWEGSTATATVKFSAKHATTVQGFELDGPVGLDGATEWISNGFQSWSQSGAIALGATIPETDLQKALLERGDGETERDGHELSWSFSVLGGGSESLLVGAISAKRFRPWVQFTAPKSGEVAARIGSGYAGESVAVAAGQTLAGEAFHVEFGKSLPALLAHYAKALRSRRTSEAHPPAAQAGWNSWYQFWDGVSEQNIRDNAPLAKKLLAPLLPAGTPLRIVVDDGWEQDWGDWQPNSKFPSGLDGLAKDLKAQGFHVGVWLAPLLVSQKSPLVAAHPDWFVQGAVYDQLKNGPMDILDVENAGAAAHLESVIHTIVSWGYDLLKIDYLFAGTYEGGRAKDVTGMQAYAKALSLIRQAAGDGTLLIAVGAPGVASLPYVDGWRVGGDIALEPFGPSWPFVVDEARSVAARTPLCLATLCDADPALLRVLPQNEVGAGGWVAAFGGGAIFLSDDLTKLDASRVAWGLDVKRVKLATGADPAIPEDYLPDDAPDALSNAIVDQLSSKSTGVVPRVWDLPDGTRVAINASDAAIDVGGTSVPAESARVLK
jgi:Melibiase